MPDGCVYNCLLCNKCSECTIIPILSDFKANSAYKHLLKQSSRHREGYAIAVDLGTSTVVIALLDLSDGTILSRHCFYNPQNVFGRDVISRIHASNQGRLPELRQLITEGIVSGIDTLLKSFNKKQPEEIIIAGNTTMVHLLLGLSCESLGVSPFKPKHILKDKYTFGEAFSRAERSALPIYIIPWITAFVGGDITSGLLFLMLSEINNSDLNRIKHFMLIDLGTNGEIALYDDGKLTVTSAAAGPAFEDCAHERGAAGVIKDLGDLIRKKKIDRTGLLLEETSFTQKEIRDLQLAKSALRSGINILLEDRGMDCYSLDAIFLAGGIGQAIDVNDAAAIELIPYEMKDKTFAVGNSSLAGAVCFSLSKENSLKLINDIVSDYKEINLAGHARFNDLFAENMLFN